jgi:zinc/manganese transport system substrate-binding protein
VPRRAALLALVPALLLAGCSGQAAGAPAASGAIRVVASTDVWGDIVQRLGGSWVQVDSIITDPDRDPHDYQSDPRDQLAVSRASIVLLNGGGYDDFLQRMAEAAPDGTRVIDAADASGLDQKPATGEFNEHLWYSFPAVEKVATAVSAALAKAAPSHRAAFAERLGAFRAELRGLERQEAAIRTSAAGKGVAITEPVPLYMTAALGLVNRTPAAFSAAVEEGGDVAPSVLLQQLDLLKEHRVAVLAYNEQTEGATTDEVLAAAKRAGIPAVGVRETLPDGQGYLAWMRADLAALKAAVAG